MVFPLLPYRVPRVFGPLHTPGHRTPRYATEPCTAYHAIPCPRDRRPSMRSRSEHDWCTTRLGGRAPLKTASQAARSPICIKTNSDGRSSAGDTKYDHRWIVGAVRRSAHGIGLAALLERVDLLSFRSGSRVCPTTMTAQARLCSPLTVNRRAAGAADCSVSKNHSSTCLLTLAVNRILTGRHAETPRSRRNTSSELEK